MRLSHQGLKVLRLFLEEPTRSLSGADIIRATRLLSGTMYPLLIRFEDAGLLKSRWEKGKAEALGRPRRRLYSITASGLAVAREALGELSVPGLQPILGGA
jgi:DNA-binding PadR family transcriptional regulator